MSESLLEKLRNKILHVSGKLKQRPYLYHPYNFTKALVSAVLLITYSVGTLVEIVLTKIPKRLLCSILLLFGLFFDLFFIQARLDKYISHIVTLYVSVFLLFGYIIYHLFVERKPRMEVVNILVTIIFSLIILFLFAIHYTTYGQFELNTSCVNDCIAMTPKDSFYFSAATFSTLGYAGMMPIGDTRLVAASEAFVGLVTLPIIISQFMSLAGDLKARD